jgi:endonuclease-3
MPYCGIFFQYMPKKEKAKLLEKALAVLSPLYPGSPAGRKDLGAASPPVWKSLLNFENPFQLLVATVLSAQCTDAAVNKVTPLLFAAYAGPGDLAKAPIGELEKIVRSTGFFRTKAHNIKAISVTLMEKYRGEVPRSMEELTALPGVGRKTASVVRAYCFGEEAIVVDTHFSRVCRRLGLTASRRPEIIEEHIAAICAKEKWNETSHVLNRFGRDICHARKPDCEKCPVKKICPTGPQPGGGVHEKSK